jgi:hypothetical protein
MRAREPSQNGLVADGRNGTGPSRSKINRAGSIVILLLASSDAMRRSERLVAGPTIEPAERAGQRFSLR